MNFEHNSWNPFSLGTIFSLILISNGAWLIASLLGYNMPLRTNRTIILSTWICAIGSIYCGLHLILLKFKHKTLKTLL